MIFISVLLRFPVSAGLGVGFVTDLSLCMQDKKIGVGIVGATGWVAGEYIKATKKNPHSQVVALCSRSREGAKKIQNEYGLTCQIYTHYPEMLKQEDLDLVVICTPDFLHAEQGIQAAEAGKHLIIEKAIALNLKDLRALQSAVNQARIKTVVSFVLRWNPMINLLRSLLAKDAIGVLFYAEVDYLHGRREHYRSYEWSRKIATGGSALLGAGCHAVDTLRYLVGSEAIEVTAYTGGYDKNYEYPPTIVTIMKFKNGVIGKVGCSREVRMPYLLPIKLFGSRGSILDNKLFSETLFPGQTDFALIPTNIPSSGDVTHHPFQDEVNHIVDCILKDQTPQPDVNDAVMTHEICLAADLSAKEGCSVKLPFP